ncbi:MAG: AAA family ATPase [Spirochaetota bacterium]
MFLKSLKIVGFKTFADETEVVFDPGFTAVVGPNGSGKSNILDAMKWVLGERSAKGLRGEKMEDVIFHGTEDRKPAGFAGVTITFDNSSGLFDLDFPIVNITRRLYPDMTNEYFINDAKAARKDVEKLLLNTGVGRSSYSVMEQGKVEALLNSKPDERRAIFDEAAGISKFKVERKETVKKLDMTKQNLLRIGDIMRSMEAELESKEKQAERAKAYFDLKTQLTESDKNLRYLKWKSFQRRLSKSNTELAEIKQKNDEIMERLSLESREIEEQERKKYQLEQKISEIDKKLLDFLSQKEIMREKVDKNKSIMQEYASRIEEEEANLEKDKVREEELIQESAKLEEEIAELDKEIKLTQTSIETLNDERFAIEKAIEVELEAIDDHQKKLSENDSEHVNFRESLKEIITSLIDQIEDSKKKAANSEEQRKQLKEYLTSFLQKYEQDTSGVFEKYIKIPLEEFQAYQVKLQEFLNIEDLLRSILFDKDGMLAQKEAIDSKIEELILENENFSRSIKESFTKVEDLRANLEEKKEEVNLLEKKILEAQGQQNTLKESHRTVSKSLVEIKTKLANISGLLAGLQEKKQGFADEVKKLEEQIDASYAEFLDMSKSLESEKSELKGIFQRIQDLKASSQKDQEDFKNLLPLISEKERKVTALNVQLDAFNEELYNDYSMTESELEEEKKDVTLEQSKEDAKVRRIKSDMQTLGSINPMAIDEYQKVKEIYDHHKAQKEDIEASKKDIEDVLRNIDKESEKLFLDSFEVIQNNFSETFRTLFNGGKAELVLTEKEDLLNTGIEIIAEPPGKHFQNLKLLSGGEKSLTVIALLFAIYMVKPSPFCFLDEVDAALDEINKTRFCQILDKFKDVTQFIVITHAPPTIARASTIFGVTNEEPGISKMVSLKIEEAKQFASKMKRAG